MKLRTYTTVETAKRIPIYRIILRGDIVALTPEEKMNCIEVMERRKLARQRDLENSLCAVFVVVTNPIMFPPHASRSAAVGRTI